MGSREFEAEALDVEAFAAAGASLAGEWPLAELPRLAAAALPDANAVARTRVAWTVRGEVRAQPGSAARCWLHLQASVELGFECQRCLQPVGLPVLAQRSFLFVQGEAQAAELDAQSEDDVLALTRDLDLRELIEDELLLSLPLVPMHLHCPEPLPLARDAPGTEAPHPFAALAALKPGPPN